MGFSELVSASFWYREEDEDQGSIGAKSRTAFQWGGTIFALLLLIFNRMAPRSSSLQTTLIVFYLFTSLPNALFNIVRGAFGSWLAFAATAANLIDPRSFPVARFVLFVVIPDYITNGLRNTFTGSIFCLVIVVLLALLKLRAMSYIGLDWHTVSYFACIAILLYYTITLWL